MALGAFGGAVNYAGKRVVVARFSGAPIVGRQVAAIGGSIISDAGAGRAFLQRIVVPVGIGRLYIDRVESRRLTPRLDLGATVVTALTSLRPRTRIDWSATASAGAPVFLQRSRSTSAGSQTLGVILRRDDTPEMMRTALDHEQVHVIQSDFTFLAWSEPLERRAVASARATTGSARFLDFRLDALLWGVLNAVTQYPDRPWEREAHFLSRTRIGG